MMLVKARYITPMMMAARMPITHCDFFFDVSLCTFVSIDILFYYSFLSLASYTRWR